MNRFATSEKPNLCLREAVVDGASGFDAAAETSLMAEPEAASGRGAEGLGEGWGGGDVMVAGVDGRGLDGATRVR